MDYSEALECDIPNYITCRVPVPSNAACSQRVALLCRSYMLKELYSDYPGGQINGS